MIVVMASPDGDPGGVRATKGSDLVRHLVHIASELSELPGEPPRLFVVTRNAQTVLRDDVANLEQAGLRGLMRVIGIENPQLRATQIDTDATMDVGLVAQQLISGSDEDETAWRNGEWYTARLSLSPLRPDERRTTVVDCEHDGMRQQIRAAGDLQSMELAAFDRVPPGPGQIEVAVAASNINFADVLVAFGRYPSFEGRMPKQGTDFAGVVTAVGPTVTDHRVGDHVGGLSANGCWSTFVTCDANLAVTLPQQLPLDRAAAVPTAHATAWYALHDLARITAGDKVLIHSATGGVGLAAIAMARAAGAEIFATAGSSWRRELLHDMGIERVYGSRSTEFADLIRKDTDGYGVDIVLNSLPGAAQREGLELLSFGGRFIEIGKRDIYGDTRMGLFPFRRNLAFHAVDLALLTVTHPDTIRRLLNTVYEKMADGTLPQPQITHYPLRDAATAVRVVSAAEHTGKIVLDIPHTGREQVVVPPEQACVFRGDGAYLVSGGLGGLGLFLAAKMAAAGCGRIVLSSRSQPDAGTQQAIERIRATGADVHVECGDIADPETAERLVEATTATGLPLRGVLHAAAVVEDATLTNITDELVERDWAPKVHGAWHLHRATATRPLDWFCCVLLGSRTGGLARPGRLRRGEQLAGRLHALAAGSGSSGHRDRLGRVGRDRSRHSVGRRGRNRDHTRRGCLRVRGASPLQPHVHRICAGRGDTVVDGLRATQPVRRSVPIHGSKPNGRKQVPRRAEHAADRRLADPAPAAGIRPDQHDPASVRRPGPSAVGVRSGLPGQPRSPHPHRDRDRNPHRSNGHHDRSRVGGTPVREADCPRHRISDNVVESKRSSRGELNCA